MKKIADLLFEANMLKKIPRSGFPFLGAGEESVAEHSFCVIFIAFVMAQLEPALDGSKLVHMCLVHDLAEARIGDMNAVQKKYVVVDETGALADATRGLDFGSRLIELVNEFRDGDSIEAKHAHDADQIALILELKDLMDIGYVPPQGWIQNVVSRLKTEIGIKIAAAIMQTKRDNWWQNNFIDRQAENQ